MPARLCPCQWSPHLRCHATTLGRPERCLLSLEFAAAAAAAGQTSIKRRSLLSGHEGFTTFLFQAQWTMERPGYVFGYLRRRVDDATVDQVRDLSMLAIMYTGKVFEARIVG
jgi:hypothetical protein